MIHDKKVYPLILGALLLATSLPSLAEDEGGSFLDFVRAQSYYAGFSLGSATADASAGALENALAARGYDSTVSIDDSDMGWRLHAGWQFHELLAAEIGYINFGELDQEVTTDTNDIDGFLEALAEEQPLMSSGMTLGVAAFVPLTTFGMAESNFTRAFYLIGRSGLYVWETEVRYSNGTVHSRKDSGTDLSFGLGAGWRFTDEMELGLSWERFNADTSVDFLNLSFQYRF